MLYNGWRKDLTTTRTSQLGRNSSCMPRPPASVRPACTVCMPERAFNLLTQRQRPVRTCTHVRRVHIYGCTTYIYDAGCIDWAKTHSVEPMYGDSKKKPTSVYIYTVLLGPESYAHTIFFFFVSCGPHRPIHLQNIRFKSCCCWPPFFFSQYNVSTSTVEVGLTTCKYPCAATPFKPRGTRG